MRSKRKGLNSSNWRCITLLACWLLAVTTTVHAEDLQSVLAKCRESVAKISSLEYHAVKSSDVFQDRRFYFACDGEKYRYSDFPSDDEEPQNARQIQAEMEKKKNWIAHPVKLTARDKFKNRPFKVAFDGTLYFNAWSSDDDAEIEGVRGSPPAGREFIEPYRFMFFWLHDGLFVNRSELLDALQWENVASTSDRKLRPSEWENHACLSAIFRTHTRVFEVAFCPEFGYLPVRVRRLEDQWVGSEMIVGNMIEFRDGEESIYFPRQFEFHELFQNPERNRLITYKIVPGTLKINQPVPDEFFRLRADPPDIRPKNEP